MRDVNPGYRADHALVAGYNLPARQYATQVSIDGFNRSLVERLEGLPGTTAAGLANALPASGFTGSSAYVLDETARNQSDKLRVAPWFQTYGDYFRAMGIPLISGRYFMATTKKVRRQS